MESRLVRHVIVLACTLISLPAGWLAIKSTIEACAIERARILVGEVAAARKADDEILTELTVRIHQAFTPSNQLSLLDKLRPLLTHRFVPEPLRLRAGLIEILELKGQCDEAARALMATLRTAGYTAAQINFVSPFGAHSAVVVDYAGGHALLDPYFGIAARADDRLLGPEEAQAMAHSGSPADQIWEGLAATSQRDFYQSFEKVSFARQGEALEFGGTISLQGGEARQLGVEDGDASDVSSAAAAAGLTPYWHYLGHRYDRAWVRTLTAETDTRVVIVLVTAPAAKLITSDLAPRVEGKRLVYELSAGAVLRFIDGRAGYNWLGLRSYLDIDFIRFEPIRLVPSKSHYRSPLSSYAASLNSRSLLADYE